MNTAERIVHFLRKRAGQFFCDDCIVRELRLSKPVTGITDQIGSGSSLSGNRNRREVAPCERCGERVLCIMAAPEIQIEPPPKSN
jgi:hypothetical protein